MQLVDLTTLRAACSELRAHWLPARFEQVIQRDRYTLNIALRTLNQRGWLTLSWHPQAARLCLGAPPPRSPDTFTFSQQLRHQLNGLALVAIEAIAPWERVVDLQFAQRPGADILWHLYVEVMGKYSNVVLVNSDHLVITAAHQVSAQQSSVRPIQTGQPYEAPPKLTQSFPKPSEPQANWQEQVSLVPGPIGRNLIKTYQGLSSSLVASMLQQAKLAPEQNTTSLTTADWLRLFHVWQQWLHLLETEQFQPGYLSRGYTVLGWGRVKPATNVQTLLDHYYVNQTNQQEFTQLRHQILQKVTHTLAKLQTKADKFQNRLQESNAADLHREQADLLMAHLHLWQPGMQAIALPGFETGELQTIALTPERNAVQNAQMLYKQHQKLKRVTASVLPLLTQVQTEIQYLEQVSAAIESLDTYHNQEDLLALIEIRDELIQQQYLAEVEYRSEPAKTQFYSYQTPSGWQLLIGRNNRQNEQLTSRVASPYDLWFHAQEIPGSHVLLRLEPGAKPEQIDLQVAANYAAYYSRARQSKQVPVIYTEPKHVNKPRGAKPGMVVYKNERVIWGYPDAVDLDLELSQPEN